MSKILGKGSYGIVNSINNLGIHGIELKYRKISSHKSNIENKQ